MTISSALISFAAAASVRKAAASGATVRLPYPDSSLPFPRHRVPMVAERKRSKKAQWNGGLCRSLGL
ncbi:hypothetical protein J7E73_29270 [Paenibacillus albidus]|uniref:hypothetical protein n=1 Tax=Paenibacillus albidus TaxID=2041023 RepID=UPI001BEA4BEA|nr:hypothetical protein [Paenibacillus albidus]MBT2293132.1 hypothetical protein [Paenibacillus albidus]